MCFTREKVVSYWEGHFIPFIGAFLSAEANHVTPSGKLCEKCKELREWFKIGYHLSREEQREYKFPAFRHHESGIASLRSISEGCHLCVLLWQTELAEDCNWESWKIPQSKRFTQLEESGQLYLSHAWMESFHIWRSDHSKNLGTRW
jgi:hypothetical protein